MAKSPFRKFETARPFTDAEAWMLFRLAAFSEAIGWTLLIAGILIERYSTPGNNAAVLIAGNIHGTIYLAYFVAALVLYPSLGWSRWRGLAALLAGVPPYGSLLFEMWSAYKRRAHGFKNYRQFMAYTVFVTSR
jgi:integral membrane protein